MCRSLAISLLFGALALPLFAQDREVTQRETAVTFSTGVNLVPVKVVVRDKDGHAVGNLERADFELRDNGKIQNIARFSVEESEGVTPRIGAVAVERSVGLDPTPGPAAVPAAATIPEHFIAYVFDDVHTSIGDLMQARAAAVKHVSEALNPSRRIAVFTVSGQTSLDFTDDAEQIVETMNRVRRWSADEQTNDCPALNYYWADLIVNRNDPQATEAAMEEVNECMRVDPQLLRERTRSIAIAWVAQGQRETRLGLDGLDAAVRRISAMPGTRTLVYVSPGFFIDRTLRGEQHNLFDRAIRAEVIVNSIDARGLYAVVPGGSIERMAKNTPTQELFQQRLRSEMAAVTSNVMAEVANATGGSFVWNDNDYDAGFRRLAAAPEYSYVLAFAPSDLKSDGSFHTLKVTLKGHKELEVFARSGYYAPDAAQDAEENVREQIRAAVFSRQEQADLPMELSIQYFKPSDLEAEITVVVKLDIGALAFQKAADRNNDVVTVVSAIFDRNGNFIKGVQRVIDLKLRDETLERLVAQGGISVRSALEVGPGSYLVRVVVRDGGGATIASRNGSVEIPY